MEHSDKAMTRRRSLALIAGAAVVSLSSRPSHSENRKVLLRLAISDEILCGANGDDARAAYRVWLEQLSGQLGGVLVAPLPKIFIPSKDLIADVRRGTLDCYGITCLELFRIADLTDPDTLMFPDYIANGIEYVLLVHKSSPFNKIADLRGAHIASYLHKDMVLLQAWLSTLLAANNLPRPEQFFASQEVTVNLNQVMLPVFFRRLDAACLTRRGWETAAELNPQLGRDLRALAVSPRLIPNIFAFSSSTEANARNAIVNSIMKLNTLPAGRQILALYQSHELVIRPISVMKSTLDMVRQFEQLPEHPSNSRKGPA
jgi:hypothetical protein